MKPGVYNGQFWSLKTRGHLRGKIPSFRQIPQNRRSSLANQVALCFVRSMRSRLEAKVAKYSLLAIFMLLALSAVVLYFGGSNNNRERKQISLLDSLNLQVWVYVKVFFPFLWLRALSIFLKQSNVNILVSCTWLLGVSELSLKRFSMQRERWIWHQQNHKPNWPSKAMTVKTMYLNGGVGWPAILRRNSF